MANIDITITIPDAHVARVSEAITNLADKQLKVEVNADGFHNRWEYSYEPKQPAESSLQFAQRVVRENIKAIVRLYEYTKDWNRFEAESSAVVQPSQNVPEDVIT